MIGAAAGRAISAEGGETVTVEVELSAGGAATGGEGEVISGG
jgi:hypothetical protein